MSRLCLLHRCHALSVLLTFLVGLNALFWCTDGRRMPSFLFTSFAGLKRICIARTHSAHVLYSVVVFYRPAPFLPLVYRHHVLPTLLTSFFCMNITFLHTYRHHMISILLTSFMGLNDVYECTHRRHPLPIILTAFISSNLALLFAQGSYALSVLLTSFNNLKFVLLFT